VGPFLNDFLRCVVNYVYVYASTICEGKIIIIADFKYWTSSTLCKGIMILKCMMVGFGYYVRYTMKLMILPFFKGPPKINAKSGK
jgi:hypothetical protein